MLYPTRKLALTTLLVSLLTACGSPDDGEIVVNEPVLDNTEEVNTYYADNPEFFSFKTLADLPDDLNWENGMHLPEIGSDEAKKGGTEYSALADFPRTLRPAGPDANGGFRRYIADDVQVPLAPRHPEAFEQHPGLAKQWAVDQDARTVYIKLNPKARWSDGESVDTDDFFFLFFMMQSEYILAPWYNNWYSTQYTNITKYDDLTFSIAVPSAKPDMRNRVLSLVPLPQHFYKEVGDDYIERYQWRFKPTTGAYVIKDEDIKKGTSITLTRLEDWWAKDMKFYKNRYNADRLHFSVVRDTAKRFEMFKKGDIDQFGLNLAEYWYDKLPEDDVDIAHGYLQREVFYNDAPRGPTGLWVNSSKPLLDNLDIRLGLQYAANWDLVIEKFFRGDAARLLDTASGYGDFSHPTLQPRPYDIEKALAYFAKAGFTERNEQGVLVNAQGQKLAFTLSSGTQAYRDVMTILKEQALKTGLELRVEVLDSTAGWKKVQEKQHDLHLSGFSIGVEMYPRFWELYHSDNAYDDAFDADGNVNPERKLKTQTNNLSAMAIHELDGLIEQYRASSDRQEMIDLSHRMLEIVDDYAGFIPGFYRPFYRLGHWRWLRYPEFFNHKYSTYADQFFIHWLDEDMRQETLAAKKAGTSFGPSLNVYDQHK